MKKLLCLLILLTLTVSATAMGEENLQDYLTQNGYDMLLISDVFTNTDSEADENGDYADAAPTLILQGCFGKLDYSENEDGLYVGFDCENGSEVYALGLAENCVLLLPKDVTNPDENVEVTDLQAWYDQAKEALELTTNLTQSGTLYVYVKVELNDMDELTRIEFVSLP